MFFDKGNREMIRFFSLLLLPLLLLLLSVSCTPLIPSVRDEANNLSVLSVDKPVVTDSEGADSSRDFGTSTSAVDDSARQHLQHEIDQLDQHQDDFNRQLSDLLKTENSPGEPSPAPGAVKSSEARKDVSFHFDGADLLEVVRLIMDQLLDANFVIHSGVHGDVTMDIDEQLTNDEIESLLLGILQINNMTMYRRDHRWHILPLESAPRDLAADDLVLPRQKPERGQQIKAFQTRYVGVNEIVKILTPYLSKGAQVYAHEASGVILVSDYPYVLGKVAKLIKLFDVGPFANLHMKVYWPKYVQAEDLIKELDGLTKSLNLNSGRQQTSFLAMPRLNLVLAMTHDVNLLEFVDKWVAELDRELPQVVQHDDEEKVFIYAVENGAAADIVSVLEGLFKTQAKPKESVKKDAATAGKQLTKLTSGLKNDKEISASRHPDAVSGTLGGPVAFVVDEASNSILIRSSVADYHKLLPVIKRLDDYPKQVLIEVTIAEVQLDESTKLGIEWQHLMSNVAGTGASGNLSVESGLGIVSGSGDGLIASGLSYLLVNTDRFTAALKAFSGQNRVNVLSSPQILASDSEQAKIDIGDEVPIVTSEYRTTDSGSTATTVDKTIQYRNVGVLLSVKPHIHDNGMVRMEVSQEVSEISSKTVEGVNSPLFSKRSAQTILSVRDGQTIVIGGLMKQSSANNSSNVPFIGRLPLLRYLFGYEGKSFSNTELMIFITPHVILNEDDSRFITRSFIQQRDKIRDKIRNN